MNEERRTKNEELGLLRRMPRNPRHSQAFPNFFMFNHKANGDTRERIGFARESDANPSSSFFVSTGEPQFFVLRFLKNGLLIFSTWLGRLRVLSVSRKRPDFIGLRTKNEELGSGAVYTLAGVSESFMTHHKAIGDTCESIGFSRVSGENPSSSFFVLSSSFLHVLSSSFLSF